MNNEFRPQRFQVLPLVVKNLLIINGLLFLLTFVSENAMGVDLVHFLGLHYFTSDFFRPHQLVTYLFMHGDFWHLFFNMFALWMFGNVLENVWGPKKFLVFYIVTGIGAGLTQMAVNYFSLQSLYGQLSPLLSDELRNNGAQILLEGKNFVDPVAAQINLLVNTSTVGASGSVYGVLLAFGMLFPNTMIFIYGLIPMKAKYFVIIFGALELVLGIANSASDNVAHFAHLGGMLFGFILIKLWSRNRTHFY